MPTQNVSDLEFDRQASRYHGRLTERSHFQGQPIERALGCAIVWVATCV